MDVDVDQLDPPHHHPAQVDATESGTTEVDDPQLRAAQVSTLEPGAMQIRINEVSHAMTVTLPCDSYPDVGRARRITCERVAR